jgi:uncharacterized membrane protein YhaH (DUF805 family)
VYNEDMSWQFVFAWSKKIHRLAMWVVMLLGSIMMFGGMVMHQDIEGGWYPDFADPALARQGHLFFAVPFTITLIIMIVTGLLLWAVPKILARRRVGHIHT